MVTTKDTRRRRDSHLKTDTAKKAAETFVEELAGDTSKGAIGRAAQKAYPNQSKTSAHVTGSKLLKDPKIQEMLAERRRRALEHASITRQEVIGLLAQQAAASLGDVLNDAGEALDMRLARERGVDHLLREITVTERSHTRRVQAGKDSRGRLKYRTETHRRTTTKYKIHDPQKAMDLLSEIAGWKREPQKNPIDVARQTYAVMRQNARYADMPDEELAKYPAERFKVTVDEILEGQSR
jgi:phage terminase small subunit